MLKIENTEVLGWEHAIRGMRNPMNSWAKSDSEVSVCECERWPHDVKKSFACLGSNDLDLMKRLRNAGTDHRKFMRMITVYVDLIGPLYWWKEFDTYKVGTVANIYKSRRNHKLDEWHTFCDWIEELPYSELITGPSLKDTPKSFSIKIPKEKVAPEVLNLIERVEREEQQRVKFGHHMSDGSLDPRFVIETEDDCDGKQ